MWSIENDYDDLCARSRHQGQGQIITSHIICGMQLLVTRGRPVFAFTQVWNLPSLNWNHREKMVTTSANYLVETFEMFSHWSYVCWFYYLYSIQILVLGWWTHRACKERYLFIYGELRTMSSVLLLFLSHLWGVYGDVYVCKIQSQIFIFCIMIRPTAILNSL